MKSFLCGVTSHDRSCDLCASQQLSSLRRRLLLAQMQSSLANLAFHLGCAAIIKSAYTSLLAVPETSFVAAQSGGRSPCLLCFERR